MSSPWRVAAAALACTVVFVLACGGGHPTQPTVTVVTPPPPTPSVTVTGVVVGTAGNAMTVIAPGGKLQLFAQAQNSDGSTTDVTNAALWQSSNPVVATVSPGGIVTAAAEGEADFSATYQSKSGSIHGTVTKPGCEVTLDPASLSFGALATSARVHVMPNYSSCRWTVKSDAAWLSYSYDPGKSGDGYFAYDVPGNNNPDARNANLIVSVVGGSPAMHTVHQDRPVGCVYQASPDRLTFGASGGTGSFTVTTMPADCT